MGDRTPAAGPARLTEREWNPITTAALKQVRKSVAALLLELPEAVWREHKGVVEVAISQMVQDQLAMQAENARYRATLEEIATGAHTCAYADDCKRLARTALAAPGAGEEREA